MDEFNAGNGRRNIIHVFGQVLNQIDMNLIRQTIFGKFFVHNEDYVANSVVQAIQFYQFQTQSCKDAVNVWNIVAKRMYICKDMRKLIGQLLWSTKEEALYEFLK